MHLLPARKPRCCEKQVLKLTAYLKSSATSDCVFHIRIKNTSYPRTVQNASECNIYASSTILTNVAINYKQTAQAFSSRVADILFCAPFRILFDHPPRSKCKLRTTGARVGGLRAVRGHSPQRGSRGGQAPLPHHRVSVSATGEGGLLG